MPSFFLSGSCWETCPKLPVSRHESRTWKLRKKFLASQGCTFQAGDSNFGPLLVLSDLSTEVQPCYWSSIIWIDKRDESLRSHPLKLRNLLRETHSGFLTKPCARWIGHDWNEKFALLDRLRERERAATHNLDILTVGAIRAFFVLFFWHILEHPVTKNQTCYWRRHLKRRKKWSDLSCEVASDAKFTDQNYSELIQWIFNDIHNWSVISINIHSHPFITIHIR